jgi:hypothetical protein
MAESGVRLFYGKDNDQGLTSPLGMCNSAATILIFYWHTSEFIGTKERLQPCFILDQVYQLVCYFFLLQ